jgi:AcrR family transcriptional regulator
MTLDQQSARPPAQTRRRSRREEILEIAVGLFASRGYHGVSMDDIGAAAGVTGPALYHHFAGKEAMLVAALAEADALAASLADVDDPQVIWELAMLRYDAARVNIGAGLGDDALERISGVAATFRGIEAFGEALQAELLHGELLLRLDRAAEAEPLLRSVLGAAPQDSQLADNAAWLLSEALEMLGRGEEAERLRREHGLSDS